MCGRREEAWGEPCPEVAIVWMALGCETCSLSCLLSLPLFSSVSDSPPAPVSVGTVSLMNCTPCSRALWMTPLRTLPHFWISSFVSHSRPSTFRIQTATGTSMLLFCFSRLVLYVHLLGLFGTLKHQPVILSKNFMMGPRELSLSVTLFIGKWHEWCHS